MDRWTEPIRALRELLGGEKVVTDPAVLKQYQTATFDTSQRVPLVVLPGSTEEVQGVVRLANQHRFPLYPVSRGRSWGLGSRVPCVTDCCVVDLQRMNRIVEFNEAQAYLTVEPGVTFTQAADYLIEQQSQLYLAAIAGPPDSSLVANALERGDAAGPAGDKARFCCAMEAVLPTGELVKTGLDVFNGSVAAKVSPFGLGPSVEGLFFQSNLAIVTRMTFWLPRRPAEFQVAIFTGSTDEQMKRITAAVRELHQLGVADNSCFSLWNAYRFISSQIQYPWTDAGQPQSSPSKVLDHLPAAWRGMRWLGILGLYASSKAQARANRKLTQEVLKPHTSRLVIIDDFTARLARLGKSVLGKRLGGNIEKLLDTVYYHSVFLGFPTKLETTSMYWRKRMPRPPQVDPDRDRCGLHWICVSLPFDGTHIARSTKIVEETAFEHNLEPQTMYLNMNEWMMKSFMVLAYDREVPGEDERALACYEKALARLTAAGYSPNRLGIQGMALAAPDEKEYVELVRRLKKLLDPNDILAPGRYDFRHRWAACGGPTGEKGT